VSLESLGGHAAKRCCQRGIPPLVVELLERHGTPFRCGGADRLVFDKAARRRLRRDLGGDRGLRVVERRLGVYAVVGDNGRIVTVAFQAARDRRR
jgi:hypothetical protein